MNRHPLHCPRTKRNFSHALLLFFLALLVPCAHAGSSTITVLGGYAYTFMSNPLDNGAYDLQSLFLPSYYTPNGLQVGEVVYVWDCSQQSWVSFIFEGAGVGTDLGYPSDWTLGDVIPPQPAPAYAIPDVGHNVYWLNPTATGAPSLPPGMGFFFVNPNNPETLTFSGNAPSGPQPAPSCGCGMFSAVGCYTPSTTFETLAGSGLANGTVVDVWNGVGWYEYTYESCGWILSPQDPGYTAPPVPGNGPVPTMGVGQAIMVDNPCGGSSSSGSVDVSVEGLTCAVPGYTLGYALTVNNFSGNTISDTLTLTGIPNYMTLTPPAGATLVPGGFSVNVSALGGCGSSVSFFFLLDCSVSALVGNSFTLTPSFASASFAPYPLMVTVKNALDPNEKTGPEGIGPNHYLMADPIMGNPVLPYAITFENQPSASAPAKRVVITDQLDPISMDLGSFQFGPITFGSQLVTPPFGANPFNFTVLSYNAGGNVVNVQINATNDVDFFSPTYGQVTWVFQTLDPSTGLPPTNPEIGFLPPNTSQPEGLGMVTYSVKPSPDLITGNFITNAASVVFDVNAAINTGTWTNTIITTIPALEIDKAPGGQLKITWAGWTLQEAGSLEGPWSNSPVQVSPWTFAPPVSMKFYRLAAP